MRTVKKTAIFTLACLVTLAGACAEKPAETSTDAGVPDDCPIGQVAGPLGTCVPDEADGGCLNTCTMDADCGNGACVPDGRGCTSCRVCSTSSCADQSQCCNGALCRPVEDPLPGCGICRNVEDECGEGAPCPDGTVCGEVAVTCSCNGGTAHMCVPDCRQGTCEAGQRCNTTGLCEPIPCADGFKCEPFATCTANGGDAHNCVRNRCRRDADCVGGFCVNSQCSAKIGQCELPRP